MGGEEPGGGGKGPWVWDMIEEEVIGMKEIPAIKIPRIASNIPHFEKRIDLQTRTAGRRWLG